MSIFDPDQKCPSALETESAGQGHGATRAFMDAGELEQHSDAPPAPNGNGPDAVPTDLSLGEDWEADGRSKDFVEPPVILEKDYFALTDAEKAEVPRDARGLPYGYWAWSREAWDRYGRENPRTPEAGPPLEVNSEGFARNRPQQGRKMRRRKSSLAAPAI
jgi:hypothetical protein